MMLLAPVVAAAIYAGVGIVAVFFVDVVTALVGVGLLAFVRVGKVVRSMSDGVVSDGGTVSDGGAVAAGGAAPGAVPGYFDDLRAGLRYIAGHSSVRWLMTLFAVTLVLIGAPSFLTPLMVARTFGPEVWKLTANEVAWAIGMLGAGLVLAWLGPRLRRHLAVVVLSVLVAGAFTALLGLAADLWVFYAFGFVVAAAFAGMSAPSMTILQTTVAPELQGRVFGFVGIVMAVAMPLSMVVFGPLADRHSVESLLLVAGVLLVLFVVTLLAAPPTRRSLAALDAATRPPAPVPG